MRNVITSHEMVGPRTFVHIAAMDASIMPGSAAVIFFVCNAEYIRTLNNVCLFVLARCYFGFTGEGEGVCGEGVSRLCLRPRFHVSYRAS